jgi:SpoVK/Ycf46/Vps4 family AAA+-type ATPase
MDFVVRRGKLGLGKGISVVFSGQSGTGKTMASEIIAHELKTVLYKIDLSTVVSKYIGETEKNLSKIFEEAEMSNCILLFDEADAIFGKRSTVKDARDRYANIETSYLLQKIEEYQGIVILTTNLLGNIDTAFLRRIKHIVHFPKPDKELRRRIWCNLWPKETPIDKRIDFTYLANNFEFSGGNIRNAAVSAAFLAAKENCPIKASHLSIAIKRETQKLGQIIPEERYIVPELDVK